MFQRSKVASLPVSLAQGAGPIHPVARIASELQHWHGQICMSMALQYSVYAPCPRRLQAPCPPMCEGELHDSDDVYTIRGSKFIEMKMRGVALAAGASKKGVMVVPGLWAGRGFSRIPRTFLPRTPQREKGRNDRPPRDCALIRLPSDYSFTDYWLLTTGYY
jgi:hypothetical protein